MIKVNGKIIEGNKFPDNTLSIFDFPTALFDTNMPTVDITWRYENDSEFFLLYCCVNHIREIHNNVKINLYLPYVYGARMDRVKHNNEVFILKHFAKFINSLNFEKVSVFDPHSDVSLGVIDRVDNTMSIKFYIDRAMSKICYDIFGSCWNVKDQYENIVLYYPDYGAQKRYSNLDFLKNYKFIYGCKTRDWETGKITGLKICNKDGIVIDYSEDKDIIKDKVVLMIDDIISYGGTLAYSADALRKYDVKDIYAYASHTENSVLDEEKSKLLERLKNGVVKKVFTTNSLYTGESEYIDVSIIC